MSCPDDEELAALAAGVGAEHWEAHLAGCAACTAVLASMMAPAAAPGTPTRLGRYQLRQQLGAGASGEVYLAFDGELSRQVAIKLLRTSLRDHAGQRARLIREAQAIAQLRHPGIAQIYDVGEDGGQVFLAMELVSGQTLSAWLGERRRGRDEILAVLLQVGQALAAAHQAGIVHRDVKPANILVAADGTVKLVDFGLARTKGSLDSSDSLPEGELELHTTMVQTRTRGMVGTPAYMAPEVLDGQPASERSDQFAYSVTLFEALEGARPFPGRTLAELRRRQARQPPALVAQPAWLRRLVRRGLAEDPAARHPSLVAMVSALEAGLDRPRRRRRRLAGLVALTLATAALVLALRPARHQLFPLGELWGPPRRLALGTAYLAAGAHAFHTWPRAEAALDGAVRRLGDAQAAVAVDRSSEVDRRRACIARYRSELSAVMHALMQGLAGNDPDQVLDLLGRVDDCLDPHGVGRLAAPPSEEDLTRLYGQLLSTDALFSARKDAEALRTAEACAESAGQVGAYAVQSTAYLRIARELASRADVDGAEAALSKALAAAEMNGDDRGRIAALVQWIYLHGAVTHDRGAGHLASQMADAALAHAPPDPTLRAQVRRAQGAMALDFEDLDTAQQTLPEALALAKEAWGTDSPRVAPYESSMARLETFLGHAAGAEQHARAGLALWTEAWGPEHGGALKLRQVLGLALRDLGRYEEAVAVLEVVRQRARDLHDPLRHEYLTVSDPLLYSLLALGRDQEARQVIAEMTIDREAQRRYRPEMVQVLEVTEAQLSLRAGEVHRALEQIRAAQAEDREGRQVPTRWLEVACLMELGEREAARAALPAAVEELVRPHSQARVAELIGLGEVAVRLGEPVPLARVLGDLRRRLPQLGAPILPLLSRLVLHAWTVPGALPGLFELARALSSRTSPAAPG